MPAATTHVEFAKDVRRLLSEDLNAGITNEPMFYLGAQGPDMLFFSNASILPGSLKKYGNLMHDEKCREVIRYFEEHGWDDPDLKSYIYGYLCHYALDSTVHPLVSAVAHEIASSSNEHEGAVHVTLEADIDVWLLHQRGRSRYDYNVYESMIVDKISARKLADLYHNMLKDVYGLDIAKVRIRGAIKEVVVWARFLSPSPKRLSFIEGFEKAVHIPSALSGMVLEGKNDFRIINLAHKSYPLAFDPAKTISASFPELYGRAALYAKKLIEDDLHETYSVNFNGVPVE